MKQFKKVDHIEISAGGTVIITSKQCPLSKEDAEINGIILDQGDFLVPTCSSNCYLGDSGLRKFECNNFVSIVYSEGKGIVVDCVLVEK